MSEDGSSAPLIWEDEAPGSDKWWLSRARDITPAGRFDYFLVQDAVTPTCVAVVLAPHRHSYRVIAVADTAAGAEAAFARLKTVAAAARGGKNTSGSAILGWRLRRIVRMVLRDFPLALAGFLGGATLGAAVAFLVLASRIVGWPVMVAGLVLGAIVGPVFKVLVDRRVQNLPVRPWARFAVITFAAGVGAAAGVSVLLTLSWN